MSCSRIRVNQGRDVALVIAPTWDTMVLQLQGCVTEKNQTVMEFTLRTLKEIPWSDLISYFKMLHPTDFFRTRKPLGPENEKYYNPSTRPYVRVFTSRHGVKTNCSLHVKNIYFSSRREIILKWILYKNVMSNFLFKFISFRHHPVEGFVKHSNEFQIP